MAWVRGRIDDPYLLELFKRVLMVTIALAGLAFAIWNQVFALMEFQVFPVFLFSSF
jgi:hypothetical protein